MDQELDDGEANGVEFDCTIPELPSGSRLRLYLLRPWNDPNYVGLNTVEIFTSKGTRADIESITSNASESLGSVESLLCVNGFRCTDPKEMWLAKYSATEGLVWVEIAFAAVTELAMIRIWNYNESRVHALRGVHEMRIELDGDLIFCGEMSCAYSEQAVVQPLGDTILFTTNDGILEAISENDTFLQEAGEITRTTSLLDLLHIDPATPSAADGSAVFNLPSTPNLGGIVHRPTTGDHHRRRASFSEEPLSEVGSTSTSTSEASASDDDNAVSGRVFHMEISANWGAPDVIGLTGVQFLGPHGTLLDNSGCTVKASNGDDTVKRILNGHNLTTKADEMWLSRFDPEESPLCLTFTFSEAVSISGISVWNYNESPEMAYAGVRCAQFYLNSRPLVGNVLLRKAPGFVFFDYVQDVHFDKCLRPTAARPNTRSISAFIYQIRLLSSWGDEFYIGLNGIEIFNRQNQLITLKPQNIAAFPESVNVLPNVAGDPRSSDKLIDGINDTAKPDHMWLTPIFPNKNARIFIIFDVPTFVSQITIFNYRKDPERGVRHVAISADDLIVFSGEVPQSTADQTGKLTISLRE